MKVNRLEKFGMLKILKGRIETFATYADCKPETVHAFSAFHFDKESILVFFSVCAWFYFNNSFCCIYVGYG